MPESYQGLPRENEYNSKFFDGTDLYQDIPVHVRHITVAHSPSRFGYTNEHIYVYSSGPHTLYYRGTGFVERETLKDTWNKLRKLPGFSYQVEGKNSPEHDAMYFSATKNGSYLEFKRGVMPAATVAGKKFVLEGTLRDILYLKMIETLKAVGKEKEFFPVPKHMEKVSVFSDQMRINYYKDAVQDKIQEAVKNGATAKDLEHQALQALKKDDYYRPDQYTGTTKEDKALRSILHQEIESMKRRGLLKENAQTGALSVSKARDQEASR